MGLDMYLKAERYISPLEGETAKEIHARVLAAAQLPDGAMQESGRGFSLVVMCVYWRKANAIHGWFIRNCAKGVDECQVIYVERDQLLELRNLCNQLLQKCDPAEAVAKLPPTPGFFFGSTEIDESYWDDLRYTVKELDRVLKAIPSDSWVWSFSYQSSW